MRKQFSGKPVARYQVFTLVDGSYVVQWENRRVQELLTGSYREFEYRHDFGHPITDYELKQLRAAGRVEHFNRDYVWLFALPESGRFANRRELGREKPNRGYYLSTTLPKSQLDNVQAALNSLGIASQVKLVPFNHLIAILSRDGTHFRSLPETEKVQAALLARAPELFLELNISFEDLNNPSALVVIANEAETEVPSLDELIASQQDTSITAGRQVVMSIKEDEEREAFDKLLVDDLKIEVKHAETGGKALELLEDYPSDLLLMDLQLPDMHGWQMISKIKEIEPLRNLPVMVIADEVNLGLTVARVDYLTRPVSIARLRYNVWKILNERVSGSGEAPTKPFRAQS